MNCIACSPRCCPDVQCCSGELPSTCYYSLFDTAMRQPQRWRIITTIRLFWITDIGISPLNTKLICFIQGTAVAQWLRSCATNRKVAGSIPDGFIGIIHPSDRTMALGSTQPLTEMSKTKLNSVALVRERTIPTERPPPVGEVSANFCG